MLVDDELIARLEDLGLGAWDLGKDPAWSLRVLALLRPRCKKLTEYRDQLTPFFDDPSSYDADGVTKHLSAPEMPAHLRALNEAYATVSPFDEATLEQSLRAIAQARGIKAGALIHGTRLAMTGRLVSPGLFEMLVLLGRQRVVARLNALTNSLAMSTKQ